MTRPGIQLIIIIFLLYSCSDHAKTVTSKKVTSFEIGYSNGWTTGISFCVDSNEVFFAPQKFDSVKYGLLPDSIFRLIKSTLLKVISDTTIKSKDDDCVDCSVLGLQAIIGQDTIRIHQVGKIDSVFIPLIKSIQNFVDSTNHPIIHAVLFLESQKIAFSPPVPPLSDSIKFLSPDTSTKSGR